MQERPGAGLGRSLALGLLAATLLVPGVLGQSDSQAASEDPPIIRLLGVVGVATIAACQLPQLVRTLRLRRADDVSYGFIVPLLFASVLLGTVFTYRAIVTNPWDWLFAASYVVNLTVWGVVLYYRVRPSVPVARPGVHAP